ncbi:MAG: TIGR03617 family F420-dependent LLM class oxidoreductase [Pseudomonadales bacterium]
MKVDTSLMFDPVKVGEMAATLEEAGFDGAYSFEGQSDPFIGLTVAAMKTSKMDLMTSIAVAFARNPMSLAYLANDLQMVSDGRFILGLGTQVKAHIERRYSMPWSKPAARMREMVQAVRAIWDSWETGERLNFQGEFYQHTLMSPTFSPAANPHGWPKIFLAGVGPLMTEVAGEVGDGYFCHPFSSTQSLDELSLPAVSRGLEKAGRAREDFQISAQMIVATGTDEESFKAAEFSARNQIAFYGSTPAYKPILEVHGWGDMQASWNQLSREGKWMEMAASVTDEMLHTFAVVGTPQEVGEKIIARCAGRVDRVSPVIYQPDTELLVQLLQGIRQASSE